MLHLALPVLKLLKSSQYTSIAKTKAGFWTASIFYPKYLQQFQIAYNLLTHV